MTNFQRITVDPGQMGGVPCVRRLRIPVATVLRLLAGGLSEREILAEYPDLETEDIRECLRFAASSAMERELALPRPHSTWITRVDEVTAARKLIVRWQG